MRQKLEDYTPIVESDEDDVLFLSNESKENVDEPETPVQGSKTAAFAEMLFDGEPKLLIIRYRRGRGCKDHGAA